MRNALLAFVILAPIVGPTSAAAQPHWTIDGAFAWAKDLRHEDAPAIGPPGGQLRVFLPSEGNTRWGGSLAYVPFGRYPIPFSSSVHQDRRVYLAGVRLRRHGIIAAAIYGELGVSLVLGSETTSDAGTGHDGGIGGYAGLGITTPRGRLRPFAELGFQGIAVMGEYTDTGGVSLLATFGLALAI